MSGQGYNTCKGPEVGRHMRLKYKEQRRRWNQDEGREGQALLCCTSRTRGKHPILYMQRRERAVSRAPVWEAARR